MDRETKLYMISVVSNAKKSYLEQAWMWEQWLLLEANTPENKNTSGPKNVLYLGCVSTTEKYYLEQAWK